MGRDTKWAIMKKYHVIFSCGLSSVWWVGGGDGRRPIECFFGPVQSELGHHWRTQWFVISIQWPGFVNLCKYFTAVYAKHQCLYICLGPSDLLITLQSVVVKLSLFNILRFLFLFVTRQQFSHEVMLMTANVLFRITGSFKKFPCHVSPPNQKKMIYYILLFYIILYFLCVEQRWKSEFIF